LNRSRSLKRPKIGLISTGDEIVSIDATPGPGQIRDINTYTLSGQIMAAGAIPVIYGIITDDVGLLHAACAKILAETDMVIISGGSSVGMRDVTIDAIQRFDGAEILVHGIPISPGKPTLLARVENKAVWGLPGHVTSAMVVFDRIVRPFIEKSAEWIPHVMPRPRGSRPGSPGMWHQPRAGWITCGSGWSKKKMN
jgi:molybdopterin molybdotransferase